MRKLKKGFSLLELIFAIVILGIIASFAIPKYLGTKDSALISTLNRDISTTVTSIQTYYLLNQNIDKIEDAVSVNNTNWTVTDTKITDKSECLSLEIVTDDEGVKTIDVVVSATETNFCEKIRDSSIEAKSYDLL